VVVFAIPISIVGVKQMTTFEIIGKVFGVLMVAAIFVGYYFHIRGVINKAAVQAIDEAEDADKTGQEKFNEAVEQVLRIVPMFFKPFISRGLVEGIVQRVFDRIKSFAMKERKNSMDDEGREEYLE